jgi:hypothetical protein
MIRGGATCDRKLQEEVTDENLAADILVFMMLAISGVIVRLLRH